MLNNLRSNPEAMRNLMTYGPAAILGTAAALSSAGEGDSLGTTALKTLAAGTGGALAGRYGTPVMKALAKEGMSSVGRGLRDMKNNIQNSMAGKGYLTAAIGAPVAALGGIGAYQGARALNQIPQAMNVPGFQDANTRAYEQALEEQMGMQAAEDEYMAAMSNNYAIDPEALGSSNTAGAIAMMG
jgi:hypothetical protein